MNKDYKIVHKDWFSNLKGSFGIVVVDNGYEKKCYMDKVYGIKNEEVDAEAIADHGAKIYPYQLAEILIALKPEEKEKTVEFFNSFQNEQD